VDPARQGRDRPDAVGRGGAALSELEPDGITIHYERRGSGSPLVLVHGLGGTGAAIWKNHAEEFSRDFTVVVPDLRGAGLSARPPGPYSLQDFVDDLHSLVDRLGLAPASVAGHSFGGSIVLEYAAQHTDEVLAVVAVGGPTELPEQSREAMRARAETVEREGMVAVAETVATNGTAPAFRDARPAEFRAYVDLLARADPSGYAATCRVVADLDIGEHLERITAPVLLVAGDRDAVAPPELNRRNAARIDRASFVEVPECGHILPWERPEALLQAVRSFVLENVRMHA
jgi:3-oxoadipate enol-lactonase